MYATTGTQWARPKLITYSFVPDGTNIGGVPSNLQKTLNARFVTADWKAQFAKVAAAWQKMANVNFTLVSDDGSALGTSGYQQGDTRFGDIRIGGYAMSGSILAFAYLAPPANGGTNAGDMFFNTSQSWQINGTTYDLMTVAIHEFGHALGLGHSTDTTAAMYAAYNATKQAVNTDDTSGIRTIYNSRQNDFFDANGSNNSTRSADDITSYLNSSGQLTLSALDSTTPLMIGTNDIDWYKITVPASTTGTMVVRMQSSKLSLLAPTLSVYDATGTTRLGQVISYNMGDTVTLTIPNATAGKVFDIRCQGSTTGDSGFGAYGLQVNFSSLSQASITPPDTTVAAAPNQSGGTLGDARRITVGTLSGIGAPMMVDVAAEESLDLPGHGGGAPWTPSRQPHRPIPISGPAIGTGRADQDVPTTPDLSPSYDRGDATSPALFRPEDRGPESTYHEAVDRALDIAGPALPGRGPMRRGVRRAVTASSSGDVPDHARPACEEVAPFESQAAADGFGLRRWGPASTSVRMSARSRRATAPRTR